MLKRWIFCLIFPVLFVFIGTDAGTAYSAEQKTFMWKVSSQSTVVYILGSIHFMKKEHYPLNRKIEDAFEKSGALAVEANVNDVGKIDIQKVMKTAFYMGNDSLEQHVSGNTYDVIKKKFEGFGFPAWIISRQKPWFLALTAVSLEIMKKGYDPAYGLDMHFLSEASGKKIKELESMDYQLGLLSGFSDSEQEAFLLYSIRNAEILAGDVDRVVSAWRQGDVEGVEALVSKAARDSRAMESVYEKLLDERNHKMVAKIEDYIRTGETHFVVVGAGHLVGKKGIIELLKAKGYMVEQM